MSDFECPMFHHGPWCDARCRKAYPLHAGASDCTHGPAIPPTPDPSEAVAEDDRALLFAAWLTTRPGVMTVGAGEHAGPMAEAVHEWRQAHPAPAPSEAVAWKVEERLKVGGPAYNTFWFGDDPERAARIRERAERHPHVSITPLYTHPAPAREVREDADFDAADALANHWSRPGAWPEQANIAHAYLVLRRGIVK